MTILRQKLSLRFFIPSTTIDEYIAPAVRKFCLAVIHHRIPEEIWHNDDILAKIFYKCLLEAVRDDITNRCEKYQSEISELLLSIRVEERKLLECICDISC